MPDDLMLPAPPMITAPSPLDPGLPDLHPTLGVPPSPMPIAAPGLVAPPMTALPSALPEPYLPPVPEMVGAPMPAPGPESVPFHPGIGLPGQPRPDLPSPWEGVGKSAKELEELSAESISLDDQMEALRGRYEDAETDEERAAITQEGLGVSAKQRENEAAIGEEKETGQRAEVKGAQAARVQAAETVEAEQRRVAAEFQGIKEKEETRLGEIEQRRAQAEEERVTSQAEYRGLLRAGPMKDASWGAMLASMAGEMLQATAERRPPNLQKHYETFRQANEQAWRGKVEASQQGVADIDDRITRMGAERAEAERQSASQRAAIIEESRIAIQQMMARATTDRERANYARVEVMLEQEQAQAEAATRQANEELQKKRTDWVQEKQLGEVKLRQERAKATMLERKLGRRGGGKKEEETVGVYPAHQVHIPEIEEMVAQFEDTPPGRKRASAVRELYPAMVGALKRLGEMEASVEDYDASIGDWSKYTASDQYTDMKVAQTLLSTSIARLLNGPGTMTEDDQKRGEAFVDIPTAGLSNKEPALVKIRALRRISEDKLREHFGALGMRPKAIEKIVKYTQSKAFSMADAAEKAMSTSVARIRDAKAPIEDRVAAVKDLLQRERKGAKDEPQGRLAGAVSLAKERANVVKGEAPDELLDSIDSELAELRAKITKDMGKVKLVPQLTAGGLAGGASLGPYKGTPDEQNEQRLKPYKKALEAIDRAAGERVWKKWQEWKGEH